MLKVIRLFSNFQISSISNFKLNPCRNIYLSSISLKRRGNTPRKPFYRVIDKSQLVLENEYIDIDPSNLLKPISSQEEDISNKVINLIKSEALNHNSARKFAIIHFFGKQYKVTADDLISVNTSELGLDVGDEILIEKVLMVGSENFSIFGRPILSKDDVSISATVVEKSPTHPTIKYLFVAKKQTSVMRMLQGNMVVFRINNIAVNNVNMS